MWIVEDTLHIRERYLYASRRLVQAEEGGQHMAVIARTFVLSSTSRGVAEHIAMFRRLFELVSYK